MVHTGHKYLLSLDITSFFPSISVARVEQLLISLGVESEVAKLVSKFVTIGGELPLGFPTSPAISNAIALPLDIELEALASNLGAAYSRYSDDLSFSSEAALPDVETVSRAIAKHGFDVAQSKTRWSEIGQAHYVTGLSVSDPLQPHVPRKKKRRLRQELYYARKFGLDDHFRHRGVNDARIVQMEVNRLDGMIKFVSHHERRLAPALKTNWANILLSSNMKPSFEPKNQHREPFHIFVDEAEFERDGQKIIALGMAVTQHANHIISESREVLAAAMEDLWAAGNFQAMEKKGLHFADATEDLRLAYVKQLAAMPFEGFVAFASLKQASEYEKTYLRLLTALLPRRLKAAESKAANLYFEENDKVSQQAIRTAVERAHAELKQNNDRRPLVCGVAFVSKPHLAISVPDFLLGVLGKYLQSLPPPAGKPEPRDRLQFERLRDKYRLILSVDEGIEYSRRRPIEPWKAT
ncbi:MAG: RNA-directed polymerase [Sphingomonadales bacterium]|nr:RNA-directed polymerase [Sphingomonadales bacterium]